jgi:hypothetical protein
MMNAPLDPRLGRIHRDDRRNAQYPIRSVLPAEAGLQDQTWKLVRSGFLDQGQTPECTGYSAAHDLAAEPGQLTKITSAVAHDIYIGARRDDEWEGEDYEGSSVLGASRALAKLGYQGEYRWAGEGGTDMADDLALALSHLGGVVIGSDWLGDMFHPGRGGLLTVSGSVAGGHAYFSRWIAVSKRAQRLRGVEPRDEPLVGGPNSWGVGWGNRGEWAMWLSDLRRLLAGAQSPGEARVSSKPFRRVR